MFFLLASWRARVIFAVLLAGIVTACLWSPVLRMPMPTPDGREAHAYRIYLPSHLPVLLGIFYTAGRSENFSSIDPDPSLRLSVEDMALGPAWYLSFKVREEGNGAYSLRGETLFFSTPGNVPLENVPITLHIRCLPRVWLYWAGVMLALLVVPGVGALRAMLQRARQLDSQPLALGSWRINKYIMTFCTLLLLAMCVLPAPTRYVLQPDTASYMELELLQPWKSIRSPGYPLFVNLLVPNAQRRQNILDSAGQEQQEAGGLRLIQVQYALLACALALFGASLARMVPWYWVPGMTALALFQVPLTDPRYLLTEPLAQAILLVCMACMVCQLTSSRWRYMVWASALASLGFWVRPALVFLLPVVGMLLLWLCWQQRHALRRRVLPLLGSLVLLGASLLYPLQLTVQSGMPTLGTLSGVSKIMFALFVANPEDAQRVKDPSAREVLDLFFADKEACDWALKEYNLGRNTPRSLVNTYTRTVNQYGWVCYGKAIRESGVLNSLDAAASNQRYHQIAMDISNPIMRHHKDEIRTIMAGSFLASFGFVSDYKPTYTGREVWGKYFFLLAIPVVVLALLRVRAPLSGLPLLLCGTHVLHVAALSYGHASLERYTQLSESIYLLGVLLGLYALCTRRKGQKSC